jgi:putative flippase GtrA
MGKATAQLGKYGSASLMATSADFVMFHIGLTYLGVTPVLATILGRSMGAIVAFLLHRSWVFKGSKNRDGNVLRLKYVLGILLGMGLSAVGVWLLNGVLSLDPWPARIVTATAVWFFGFLFNKKIVFG